MRRDHGRVEAEALQQGRLEKARLSQKEYGKPRSFRPGHGEGPGAARRGKGHGKGAFHPGKPKVLHRVETGISQDDKVRLKACSAKGMAGRGECPQVHPGTDPRDQGRRLFEGRAPRRQ